MLLHIFGLVTKPSWWHLNRVPARGGPELAVALATQLPNAHHLEFFIDQTALASLDAAALRQLWSSGVGELVAKPRGALVRDQPDSRLWLVTTAGPDSGRLFPLTRRNLSVGRSGSRAQVRDPWLSAHDFNIRLSADGTLVTPVGQRGFYGNPVHRFEPERPSLSCNEAQDSLLSRLERPARSRSLQVNRPRHLMWCCRLLGLLHHY